jgi:hypothetical protein
VIVYAYNALNSATPSDILLKKLSLHYRLHPRSARPFALPDGSRAISCEGDDVDDCCVLDGKCEDVLLKIIIYNFSLQYWSL